MKLVYENKLSCENDVKDFVLEGSAEIYFENGKMRMKKCVVCRFGTKVKLCVLVQRGLPVRCADRVGLQTD